ncbi:MAG: hypothetical protein WD096_03030 [Actinomycetota bacterium]
MASEPKGDPFSIRLSRSTQRLVEAEAKRTRRSKSAIVESLTEEAARVRRFPGIGFHGDDVDRVAWVIGTSLDAWEVVEMYEDFGSIDKLVEDTHLTAANVRLALAYREAYPNEINDAIAENRRSPEEWAELYPFVVTLDL